MKPSFALNLTEDGVTLLHRTARGWTNVGQARFEDPDFAEALEFLRNTALELSPKGITTKLVIPNSQILYIQIAAPGPGEEERRAQIAAALEGRTPYDVADLAFDWSGDGPEVKVAVVAKETLGEAEAFATEHRFNPVSFVAMPEGDFGTEPFFGTATAAASVLTKSQKVERDREVISIIGQEPAKPAEAVAESLGEPVAEAAPPAETPPEPEPQPEPQPEQNASDFAAEPVAEISAKANMPTDAEEYFAAPEPAAEPVASIAEQSDEKPEAEEPAVGGPAKRAPEDKVNAAKVAGPDDEAPMAVDVPFEDDIPPMPAYLRGRVTSPQAPALDDDIPPALSAAAQTAFASRRASNPLPTGRDAPKVEAKAPSVTKPVVDAPAPRGATAKAPTVERPTGARPTPKFSYDDPVPPPPRMPGDPPVAPPAPPQKAGKGLRNLGLLVASSGSDKGKVKRPAAAKPSPAAAVNPAEGANTSINPNTLGQGLGARRTPPRGKPKYLGLALTAALLLILAIVAAWSSLYLTQGSDTSEIRSAQTGDPDVTPDAVDPAVPTIDEEAAADGLDAVAEGPAETDLANAPAAEGEDAPAPGGDTTLAALPGVAPAIEPAPNTAIDSTAATSAQPGAENQDEIFLAGMDAPPSISDPLTLGPLSTARDASPEAPMPPPPFGTVYQFDADGRIVPTPEGITTPEGVELIAGRPPVLPPVRPEAVTALASAPIAPPAPEATPLSTEAPAQLATDVSPADTFAADPALADNRPRSRPADLAPAAPAAGEDDDASLAPAEDSRFASLRPRPRPQAVLAAGEASRRASEAASLAAGAALSAATDAAVAEANADGSISPLAVSVSRVPAPRPRDLSRAVEAAVAAATQPSRTTAAAASAPAPQEHLDESDEEPEVASVAPRIPTKANVAKQATYVNAINLSKINLVGVYGTQSKRYALIRQSNGRYKKVRVGDRIDGGTIQAITANEVRYQKGGRLISLEMPKG